MFIVLVAGFFCGGLSNSGNNIVISNTHLPSKGLNCDSPFVNNDQEIILEAVRDSALSFYKSAHPKGGDDSLRAFIQKNLKQVNEDIPNGNRSISIYIKISIDTNGSISVIPELSSIYKRNLPEHYKEACRVARLIPKWIPTYKSNDDGIISPQKDTTYLEIQFPENLYYKNTNN